MELPQDVHSIQKFLLTHVKDFVKKLKKRKKVPSSYKINQLNIAVPTSLMDIVKSNVFPLDVKFLEKDNTLELLIIDNDENQMYITLVNDVFNEYSYYHETSKVYSLPKGRELNVIQRMCIQCNKIMTDMMEFDVMDILCTSCMHMNTVKKLGYKVTEYPYTFPTGEIAYTAVEKHRIEGALKYADTIKEEITNGTRARCNRCKQIKKVSHIKGICTHCWYRMSENIRQEYLAAADNCLPDDERYAHAINAVKEKTAQLSKIKNTEKKLTAEEKAKKANSEQDMIAAFLTNKNP